MQNEKIIKWLEKSLASDEIIMAVESVDTFVKGNRTTSMHFAVTTKRILFINNSSIFRQKKLQSIKTITISAASEQIVFHAFQDDQSWFQCKQRLRLIANFLTARKKFVVYEDNQKRSNDFSINISVDPSLESCVPKIQGKAEKFFSNIFKKNENSIDSSAFLQNKARESDKFITLTVNDKDFALKIGQKIYQMTGSKNKLLYILPKSDFIFNPNKLQLEYEDHTKTKQIYTEKIEQKQHSDSLKKKILPGKEKQKEVHTVEVKKIIVEKIKKISEQDNQIIRKRLMNYKNFQYKEEILFAIESSAYFKIVTNLKKNFGHRLIENYYTLQMDLKSIFHRLISLIQHSNTIIYGLTPQKIHYDANNQISISEFQASLKRFYELDYISPEQLQTPDKDFTKQEIQHINIWKAGVLLYELAYGNVPFTAYYIAYCVKNGRKIKLHFPLSDNRSIALKNFLISLLQVDPNKRGGSGQENWKQKMFKNKWISSPI